MWSLSVKFHPAHDLVVIPDASILPLDPSSDPPGISHKVVLDATTPIAPENRGHFSQEVDQPAETEAWENRISRMLA
jgi:3-polyprenyl-4-hydroxybenzoate decarboxylase